MFSLYSLPPSDPSWAGIYHYGLIILYAVVLITIIVVAIKSCIVLFEKSDTSKLDGCKGKLFVFKGNI